MNVDLFNFHRRIRSSWVHLTDSIEQINAHHPTACLIYTTCVFRYIYPPTLQRQTELARKLKGRNGIRADDARFASWEEEAAGIVPPGSRQFRWWFCYRWCDLCISITVFSVLHSIVGSRAECRVRLLNCVVSCSVGRSKIPSKSHMCLQSQWNLLW
jgi:hypothetical protein